MKSPNFLILDEPTNDLDIITLQILEEYLTTFKGCVIVVSHDRYFMDKVVDHVLVFKGNGEIKDFPGNYTQYREWQKLQESEHKQNTQIKDKSKQEAYKNDNQSLRKRKMSFKEKNEKVIEHLESEKKTIEKALSGTVLNPDKIKELSKRLYDVNYELELKSERWFELAEIIG